MSDEEKKQDASNQDDFKQEAEVPEKFKSIVESIEKLSVLELSELVKILEDKFGVSASAPMVMAQAGPGAGEVEAAEEKTQFDVELTDPGSNKIAVIKVIRAHTELGLKEAKDMVDNVPKVIKSGIAKDDAEKLKKEFEEAGGKAVLK
jgi:large subunit ribosomal protein L7/L12